MRQVTLVLPILGDTIYLAMKKRGFGAGRWNGFGGKVHDGETIIEATCREAEEEGLKLNKEDLKPAAIISFHFPDKPDYDQQMNVFTVSKLLAEPIETEEMKPQAFKIEDVPYDEMWSADRYWMKEVINGQYTEANVVFHGEGSGVRDITFTKPHKKSFRDESK
ncbi:MAG: NUDIX domain-containing protein [Candidatus Woesearchaeota archaeon]